MDVRDFVGLMVDPERIAVLGRAALGPLDIDELAAELGVNPRRIQQATARLAAAGLLTDGLELDRDALRRLAMELPRAEPAADDLTDSGEWTAEEARVLSRFFSGKRLTRIPAGGTKRSIVLERLAQEFEPGLRYSEPEVNFTLQLWHPDYAALRRYLVDEGFMTRADGVYWRTGGRYHSTEAGPTE